MANAYNLAREGDDPQARLETHKIGLETLSRTRSKHDAIASEDWICIASESQSHSLECSRRLLALLWLAIVSWPRVPSVWFTGVGGKGCIRSEYGSNASRSSRGLGAKAMGCHWKPFQRSLCPLLELVRLECWDHEQPLLQDVRKDSEHR